MALPPTAVKWIAIVVLVVVVVFLVVSIVWEALKIAVGLLIGGALIYLGVRFLLGKGLPKPLKRAADKALKGGKVAKKVVEAELKESKDKAESKEEGKD
jgi:O-antigen/teichoic acid export membrane protein